MPDQFIHRTLDCGIEFAANVLPDRHTVSFELRFLAGMTSEPADLLGLARIVEETMDKGTEKRDGRGLADAFDAIGVKHGSWTGRQATGFNCICMPEHLDQAIDLHAEMLRTPTFPDDMCEVAKQLGEQELSAEALVKVAEGLVPPPASN